MKQSIAHVALIVRDYDEAIEFFTTKLNFDLVEDIYQPEQQTFIGNQSGGRVFLFLRSDDFWRDYNSMVERGITFVRSPREENYGRVAVFEVLHGNLWDLIQYSPEHPLAL